MTIMEAPTRSNRASNSRHRRRSAVERHAPDRTVRMPELVVGVLVVVVFALGAVLWHLSSVEKVPALVLSAEVKRGDVIEPDVVQVTYLSSDTSLDRLGAEKIGSVVGQVALVDLDVGTLLTSSMVADSATVGAGQGIAGIALDPGAYPSRGLAPGDRVNVIRSAEAADLEAAPSLVARGAMVTAVEELPSDRLLVTVLTSEADAERVAATAGAGGLRLVVVAP